MSDRRVPSNSTHRKRLARAFAEQSGRPYAACLEIVRRAAEAGRLPEPLDEAGMAGALRLLMAVEAGSTGTAATAGHLVSEPGPQQPNDDKNEGQDSLYLIRSHLVCLRMVWQGRVTKEPAGRRADQVRFTIDERPAPMMANLILVLLERDGYIEARLPVSDDWVIARPTEKGETVLVANGADQDKFLNGLPPGVGADAADTGSAGEPGGQEVPEDRFPYVGEGLNGARRSAQIDREEADGLDLTDPRYTQAMASAARWDEQAARIIARERSAYLAAMDKEADAKAVKMVRAFEPMRWRDEVFLLACAAGDATNLLTAATNLAQAPLVETWRYPSLQTGQVDAVRVVRRPGGALRDDGGLVLRGEAGAESVEQIPWQGPAASLARHWVHPDGLGVTLADSTGRPSTSHRALFEDSEATEDLTSLGDLGEGTDLFRAAANAYQSISHDEARCEASSWRAAPTRDGNVYGPGFFNRCVKADGHHPSQGGTDEHHLDTWGNLFLLDGENTKGRFRVIATLGQDEVAQIAREQGRILGGVDVDVPPLPRENTLWVTGGKGASVKMVQISHHYADEGKVSARLVLPVPPRTTVKFFTLAEVRTWREPTDAEVRRYERAWGFAD